MGREDYHWVQGGKLRTGMFVLDIGGNAQDGSVPEGVGVVGEITKITPAAPGHNGQEYVKLHLKEVRSGKERTRYASKAKLFEARAFADSALEQVTTIHSKVPQVSATTQSGEELEYRISSSYPFLIAFGFRSLRSIVDYRDLYREQLRIAENILAFLASVSLTLLQEPDRRKADINLEEYWRSGISPGDWKDIVGRCSRVFSTYEDNPLALGISSLNIRSEKKGFGHDVAKLIQAKNDYEHDRGPTVLEDIAEASQEVQERLKRCMERLSFFGDYPIRQVEDFNFSRSGNEVFLKTLRYMGDHPSFPQEEVVFHKGLPRGDLFLDLDGGNWVPLYPFIVSMTCSHCKARETYFIDLWDPGRGTARMKSFERGHTMPNTDGSEALASWNS